MSKEAALSFLMQAAENAEMQKKIVAFAAQEGYEFSADELTDAELDQAAGGIFDRWGRAPGTVTISGTTPTTAPTTTFTVTGGRG